MAVNATWHVTLTRADGSFREFTMYRDVIPVIGTIETIRSEDAVVGLEDVRFQAVRRTYHSPRAAGLGVYDVGAKELK
jgi:hypothetical protein